MTASGSVTSVTASSPTPIAASQATDDVYASPPRILPHSGLLQQGALPAGVRRPVAQRAGFPSPQSQQQQQGYGEMTSLVASRYGERYASAPALSSANPGAGLTYSSTNTLHRSNRLTSGNHYNTMGGHRRYHTPIGSSTAELSVFSSDASLNPHQGQRSTTGSNTNSIRITTPGSHNSLDRRLFTRNQNQNSRNHTLTMMRHHHQAGRNSSASWHNQSSPHHHHHQQQQTSPPILTPSPSDSGFASGVENSASDLTAAAAARGARNLTSVTPSGVSIASGRTSSGNTVNSNPGGRVCRSSKIYINGDGDFFSDDNRSVNEKNAMVSCEIFSNAKLEHESTKPGTCSVRECDKYWDFCSNESNNCNSKSNRKDAGSIDECTCYQVTSLRSKLEEAMWEQGRIRGEAALLRQQLKDARNALSARELDLMRLKHDTKQNYECPGDSRCAESERLRAELSERVLEFEAERERWLREKKQVLRYQRCLLQQLADSTEEHV